MKYYFVRSCLILAVVLSGCVDQTVEQSAAIPTTKTSITVTDVMGRSVSLAGPAQRIVLLRGRDVHEVALLLQEELPTRLVGWGSDIQSADQDAYHAFIQHFPSLQNIPVIGSVFKGTISVETVISLQPDLIIAEKFMLERGYVVPKQLRDMGLPILFLDFSSHPLQGPQQSLLILGKALGAEQQAQAINDFCTEQIAMVQKRLVDEDLARPRVYVEVGNRGPKEFGTTYGSRNTESATSWGKLLAALPCQNIAADSITGMARIAPEFLLQANPEHVIITGAYWPAVPQTMHLGLNAHTETAQILLAAFCTRPGWQYLQAVQTGQVHGLFHGFCMHLDSFVAYQQLALWFWPDRFADLDPVRAHQLFYKRFSPLPFSGTWCTSLAIQDTDK